MFRDSVGLSTVHLKSRVSRSLQVRRSRQVPKLKRPRVEGLSTSGHGVPSSLGLELPWGQYFELLWFFATACKVGVLRGTLQVVASCQSVTARFMREGPRPQCVRMWRLFPGQSDTVGDFQGHDGVSVSRTQDEG